MRLIGLAVILAVSCVLAPLAAEAQRPSEVRRIGYLQAGVSGLPSSFYEILREGLRDLGYVEGRNIIIEYRAGEDRLRGAELVAELVRLNVEVIVTPGAATSAAKKATETVPIVFSYSGDPIEAGFVKSLARPGGNMTGITWLAFELVGQATRVPEGGCASSVACGCPVQSGASRRAAGVERNGADRASHRLDGPVSSGQDDSGLPRGIRRHRQG